jgi:predicted secreted hydrolase
VFGIHVKKNVEELSKLDYVNNQNSGNANKNINKNLGFSPEDIELKDDAYHGINESNSAEWWYFDTILNDGYNIQIILYVFDIMKYKFAYTSLHIFKDGKTVFNKEQIYFNNDFFISAETPLFVINGEQVMIGYINDITGEWIYNVSIDMDSTSVDLQFIGCAKGWKGDTIPGGWAVILPKAHVKGIIKVNGEETAVVGKGYHDHNWDLKLQLLLSFGWYWGRIISSNYSIVYFVMMDTRISRSQVLLIIAQEYGPYINIDQDEIQFIENDFGFKNGKLIPHSFKIIVETQNISLEVDLITSKIFHGFTLGIKHYWRYFVESQGYVMIDEELENIQGMQIIEFWRFR